MKNNAVILPSVLLFIGLIFICSCEPPLTGSEEANPFIKKLSLELTSDRQMDYWLLLPECYDSTSAYPAVLALPPGGQSIDEVEWAINLYYIRQSIQRNWLVISPAAPGGIKFHEGAEIYIPLLLAEIEKAYHIEDNKYHLAGISNGGISAFRLGTLYPARFQSMTVFPGVPTESDQAKLNNLVGFPVTIYVGAADAASWITGSEETAFSLDSLGGDVVYKKWANNGHVITSLTPENLFDLFESHRPPHNP